MKLRRQAGIALAGVIALGCAIRVALLTSSLGCLNSDEALTGLQSKELLRGHAWVLIPGTNYGGNTEAWLNAPFEALMRASPVRLKLISAALWLATMAVVYRLVRTRLGPAPALVAAGVIWLPSAALVILSLQAYPGYGAGLLSSAIAAAAAYVLIENSASRRAALVLGFFSGFAVWQHPLFVQAVAPFVLVVLWRQRSALRVVAPALVGGGVVALAAPLYYNLRHGWPSLSPEPQPFSTYGTRVAGWFLDVLPRGVGAISPVGTPCASLEQHWVLGRIGMFLATVVIVGVAAAAVTLLRHGPWGARAAAIAVLTAPFTLTLFRATYFTDDARYAHRILVPAALVVGHSYGRLAGRWQRPWRTVGWSATWAALAVALPLLTTRWQATSSADVKDLVRVLDAARVSRVRADFWIAQRLSYETDERIIASPTYAIRLPDHDGKVQLAESRGEAALVLDNSHVAAYLRRDPLYVPYQEFRRYPQVRVAQWTVFLPPSHQK